MKFYLFIFLFTTLGIYSWPGDQDSLFCKKIFGEDKNVYNPIIDDIKAQYASKGSYATTDEAKKIQNQTDANERVRVAIRKNHDMDYEVTKLGDSESDLVDFYGVATPRKLFPLLGDAGGTFGGHPLFMDSWDDYMTAGAGIANSFKFQNFGKSGNTTLDTMSMLGIDIDGDRENWNVKSDATRCVKTRPKATGAFIVEYTDGILKEQSSMRSTLLINGNDILKSQLGFNGWLPFLNKYQVDSSLLNIMAITDWHIENGKQIFLEGTIPPYSLPAREPYNTVLMNRKTLCRPLSDLLVDTSEIPWYAVFFPGIMESIIKWDKHVLDEVEKFHTAIWNAERKNNTESPGGFINELAKKIDENLEVLLDAAFAVFLQTEPHIQAFAPEDRDRILAELKEKQVLKKLYESYNNTASRILFSTTAISQACLNDRIRDNMLPLYKQAYPKNVDGYPLFSNFNQTGDDNAAANFWTPPTYVFRQRGIFGTILSGRFGSRLDDGPYGIAGDLRGEFIDPIHIGPEGYKIWGISIGSRLSALGYQDVGDPNSIPIEVSLELNDAWGIITKTARKVGVIGMEATARGVTVPNVGKDYGGYYRQYTEGSGIYLKLFASNTPENAANVKYRTGVIHLPNNVNSRYKSNGGPEGKLGFPMTGTMCWGPGAFCNYKLTLFEKGFIQVDETPLIGGGVSVATAVTEVPKAKENDTPDFDTCVSSACGSRWFEHNKVYLQPTAGKPPFTFQVISGNLPPGFSLTPTGLLFGGPTNTQGSWTFRVMIIDSKNGEVQTNSSVKSLTFSTGL